MTTFDYILIGVWVLLVLRFVTYIVRVSNMPAPFQDIIVSKTKHGILEYSIIIIPIIIAYRVWG